MDETSLNTDEINEILEYFIAAMRPSQMKAIMLRVGRYLRDKNKKRITAQVNSDGSPYRPRKKITSPGSMKTATFQYNGGAHKVFVIRETAKGLLGFYVRKDSGTNYRWFTKAKMSEVKYGRVNAGKKMLTGFRKNLKVKASTDQGGTGAKLYYQAGKAAYTHHLGLVENGVQYPARQLLGLSEEDKLEAINLIMGYFDEVLSNLGHENRSKKKGKNMVSPFTGYNHATGQFEW